MKLTCAKCRHVVAVADGAPAGTYVECGCGHSWRIRKVHGQNVRLCECGQVATQKSMNFWVCQRCFDIKPEDFHLQPSGIDKLGPIEDDAEQ